MKGLWGVLAGVVVLLLLPHCFSHREADSWLHLGPPKVHAGDEPHYLVFINSLARDGDLKLANNYESALAGSLQAGKRYQGRPLDHHSAWYEDGERRHWREFYEIDSEAGTTALKEGAEPPGPHIERPHNVPGLAILLTPILWPFAGTGYLESVAVILSGLAMALAAAFFAGILRHLTSDRFVIGIALVLAFLGTPLWHYGRSLFPEAYLPCFLLGALYFHFVSPRPFVVGVLLALGFWIKPPFALTAIPFLVDRLWDKDWRGTFWLGAPLGVAVVAYWSFNWAVFGHPMPSPVDLEWGTPWTTWFYQWIAWDHGLLSFAPVAALALIGWLGCYRAWPRFGAVVLGTFFIYYTFIASISIWTGGYCYGPRYLVPIIPLLMLGLVGYLKSRKGSSDVGVGALAVIGSVSMTINFLGAVPYWAYWTTHPLADLFG